MSEANCGTLSQLGDTRLNAIENAVKLCAQRVEGFAVGGLPDADQNSSRVIEVAAQAMEYA